VGRGADITKAGGAWVGTALGAWEAGACGLEVCGEAAMGVAADAQAEANRAIKINIERDFAFMGSSKFFLFTVYVIGRKLFYKDRTSDGQSLEQTGSFTINIY
jgi:hypothetical protein